ncbi:MAG: hypothetical protein IPJ58_10645 [Ardenticatenia bacterium]|nr:hypothetical protein [Ardenticatenia bacterium]
MNPHLLPSPIRSRLAARRRFGGRAALGATPLALVLLAILGAGCSKPTPATPGLPGAPGPTPTADPNAVVWLLAKGPGTLDPGRLAMEEESASLDPAGQLVAAQVYDRLVSLRPGTAQLAPGLAETWQQNIEENTVTFKLREGLTFQDGSPLGAREVTWNFERWMNPEHPAHLEGFQVWDGFFGFVGQKDAAGRDAFIIKAVEAIGPLQVRFKLNAPFSPFLYHLALASFGIASPQAVQAQGDRYGTDGAHLPVGSGPYRVVSWDESGVYLVPNEGHWGAKAVNSGLRFNVEPDPEKRALTVAEGRTHGTDLPARTVLTGTLASPSLRVQPRPARSTAWLMLDDSRPPLNNAKVRLAISLAIDRPALVAGHFGAFGLPTGQLLPPGFFGHAEDLPAPARDLERAKGLLKEAEVDSFKLNIWVPQVPRPFLPDPVGAAEQVARDLVELGLEAQAQSVPLRQFLRDRETGRYTAWIIGWEAQSPDPDNFWYWHFGIADRVVSEGHYDNRALAQALAQAQRLDTDSRRQIYLDAARTVDADTARVFLANTQGLVVTSRRLRGFQPGPMGIDSLAEASLGEPEPDPTAGATPASPAIDVTPPAADLPDSAASGMTPSPP